MTTDITKRLAAIRARVDAAYRGPHDPYLSPEAIKIVHKHSPADLPWLLKLLDCLTKALRAQGRCAAVSRDGLRCERRYGHSDAPGNSHHTRRGAFIFWPDSERDREKSAQREREIWAGLLPEMEGV